MKQYLILLSACTLIYPAAPSKNLQPDTYDEAIHTWSRTMSEAFHLVKTRYYDKNVDVKDAMSKAINAFVSLDPHSSFLDPKSHKEILESTSGEFFGIGVVIAHKNPDDEFLTVIDVIIGGPADKVKIRPHDKIVEIDGVVLKGMTTEEATAKLKGIRHSIVHVKIVREHHPEPLNIDVTRDLVKEQNLIGYYFKNQQVYYLHMNMFSQNAVKQITDLIKKSQKQKSRGLIIDLRNNSGGLLQAAIEICGLFLEDKSLVCTTKNRDQNIVEKFVTSGNPIVRGDLPIFILINNYTASAAEILAGCLKVHGDIAAKKAGNQRQQKLLVFIVGTTSFGKGSVQEVITVSNDSAIKLTTALYFLPDDITIQGVGIKPDLELERKFPPSEYIQWLTKAYGTESGLRNTIKGTKEKPDKKKPKKKDSEKSVAELRREAIVADSQIKDTLTCINVLTNNPHAWKNRTEAVQLLKKTLANEETLTLEEISKS